MFKLDLAEHRPIALATSATASAPAHHGSANPTRPENTFVRHASEKVLDSAEEEAGKKGVDYISQNAPQDMDDMKAQAQVGGFRSFFQVI